MQNDALNNDASGDSVNSSEVMEKLGAYVDGELSPVDRESIEALLERDRSCREVVQSFRFLDDAARRETVPSVNAEEWARIWETIQVEKDRPLTSTEPAPVAASPRGGKIVHGWFFRLAAAAAVIALAFVGFQLMVPRAPDHEIVRPEPVEAPSAETASLEEGLDILEPDDIDGIGEVEGRDAPEKITEDGVSRHDF